MNQQTKQLYEFGPFRLIPEEHLLLREGQTVTLAPKDFEVLVALVRRGGSLVGKEELLKEVWPDSFVEEANLSRHVYALRRTLGEDEAGRPYIETVPKKGYRFTANVAKVEEPNGYLVIEKSKRTEFRIEETYDEDSLIEAVPTRIGKTFPLPVVAKNRRLVPIAIAALLLGGCALLSWQLFRHKASPANDVSNIHSIAVLPFAHAGETQAEDEYLTIGLPDALITRLSNLREVKVRPTSAIRKYAETKTDSLAVGRELGVEAILEGTIRREGERVRVTAQLVRVSDGATIWADSFNENRSSLMSLEDAVALRLASRLSNKFSETETARIAKQPTQNPEAYHAYLKGQFFFNKRGYSEVEKAGEMFKRAIALDSNFVLAYVGLAAAYSFSPPQSLEGKEAESLVRRAIDLDPNSVEARSVLAFILSLHDWKWDESEAEFKRAIELNPNYAMAHQWYATNLTIRRRFTEAEVELRKALELDPLSLPINADLCEVFYFANRYDEAIAQCRKTLDLDEAFFKGHSVMNLSYTQKQMYAVVVDDQLAVFKNPEHPLRKAFERDGGRGFHEWWIETLKTQPDEKSNYMLAYHYAMLGDRDSALHWLERAGRIHHFMLPFANAEPAFKFMRDDARFKNLIRQINLENVSVAISS